MILVLWLLLAQCAMGAFDSFWHHELTERLPHRRAARRELTLHAAREFLYAIVFVGIAWRTWQGAWAYLLVAILLAEIWITLADFLEEDRTRLLPPLERVIHTVLAMNYGIWLGVFAPYIYEWARRETGLVPVDYGALSSVLTIAGMAVFVWSLRNVYAVLKHSRPPRWVREPLFTGESSGRTVLITGATGFIGSALVRRLVAWGDAVIVLARDVDKALDRFGPHVRIVSTLDALEDASRIDAIVNLAGAPILGMPWFKSRRRLLVESRLSITKEVVRLCERLHTPPSALISGSAIGYYGVREDEECDESTPPQPQFQSELCRRWEATALTAESLGVRVVLLRTGLVLGATGGALPGLSLPVRLFLGAVLGDGRQWMSWIHIDDMLQLIEFAIERSTLRGAVNATAPQPVRHGEFQKSLARQLHRRIAMRVPAWPLRRALGEMSQLLLDGQRVLPHKLGVHGFRFRYPTLRLALGSLFPTRELKVTSNTTEVFFNGECPVCNFEMAHYARIANRNRLPLCFVDSIREPQAFACYGLRSEHLEERLYVRDPRGRIVSGMAAVLRVWQALPGYRWAARIVGLPGFKQLAIAVYDLIIAPTLARWARRRVRLQAASVSQHG